jgi:hypothetical protein
LSCFLLLLWSLDRDLSLFFLYFFNF